MNNRRDLFSARPYRHFDTPLPKWRARALATNAERVARHSFFPFLQRTIETPRYLKATNVVDTKRRVIAYAAHADSVIYAYYGSLLAESYEKRLTAEKLGAVPVAYRQFDERRCNVHFALQAFEFIDRNRPCVALGFDVTGFFDNIDHALLLQSWGDVLGVDRLPEDHYRVYRSLTNWSRVDETVIQQVFGIDLRRRGTPGQRICSLRDFKCRIRGKGHIDINRNVCGIPQGSPMSAVLSNIFMLPFDLALSAFVSGCGGFVQRYCDDIFVVVPLERRDDAFKAVMEAADERKLSINTQPHKLDQVSFPITGRTNRPIQYLGLVFDGERVMLRPQTLSRYHRKLRRYIKKARARASKNPTHRQLYTKTLWFGFTHKGRQNFISYAHRAARIASSEQLRKQVRRHADQVKDLSRPPEE